MQDYINYIIGILVVLVILIVFYMIAMPTKPAVEVTTQDQSSTQTTPENINNNNNNSNNIVSNDNNKNIKNTHMKETYIVKMETTSGQIVLELNSKIAPKTVENFVKLAQSGFYNGIKFHRVIQGFMIQGGDPLTKDDSKIEMWGTGGPGYRFEDEIFDTATYQNGYKRGILAMANSGPNTNGSQFFIMHKDTQLPPDYTIFGKIKDGDVGSLKTVDAIASVPTGPADRPNTAITITKISVE